jgi:hypothetical protein
MVKRLQSLYILMSIYFVGRLGDEEVKVHYCLVGCDPVYTASSLQVSVVCRTFLIRGCYIATTALFFMKIPLFEITFCFPHAQSGAAGNVCLCVCVCVWDLCLKIQFILRLVVVTRYTSTLL